MTEISEYKKQREALAKFYQDWYDKDAEFVKKEALKFADGDIEKAKAFIEGYKFSILQPHSKTLRMMHVFMMDFVPAYRKTPPDKWVLTCIRDKFRNKTYPSAHKQDEDIDNT